MSLDLWPVHKRYHSMLTHHYVRESDSDALSGPSLLYAAKALCAI